MSTQKTNILSLNRERLEQYFLDMGEKRFRASQVMKWVYQSGVVDFSAMSNISKALREQLAENACVEAPGIKTRQLSTDGTCKWLMSLADGNAVETVFIPENDRGTLCVSSQVGCSLHCSFCSTARQGFNRNLAVDEIIGQVWRAVQELAEITAGSARITNIVMMGMGEPLANFDSVVEAMDLMMDDLAFGLARKRVTLSTAGMVPVMGKLRERSHVSLAVSLHAANDELRNELVPLNKKYPLGELIPACRDYVAGSKQKVTFEYVMLAGVNDSPADARQLARLLAGVPSKVNLIPFNPFPGAGYQCPERRDIDRFREILMKSGLITVTRKTRGDDIDAACGQLRGSVMDRTRRSARYVEVS